MEKKNIMIILTNIKKKQNQKISLLRVFKVIRTVIETKVKEKLSIECLHLLK